MADKRSRKRKAYSLKQVKLIGSHALMEMERIILSGSDNTEKIRACNAISSLMNSYTRMVETQDIIERLEALEAKQLKKVS